MRSKFTTLLTVIGAVTVLVLAANTVAMATTGKAILAGKINTASKMTSITRTTVGTGLQVKTRSTANAPLAVNGTGKVVNLNSDRLDGRDSTSFAPVGQVPVAVGYVSGAATPVLNNARGIDSVTWDAGNSRYLITLTGQPFYYLKYSVAISPICENTTTQFGSVGNKLIVKEFAAATGTPVQCGFSVVVFKLA